MLRVVCAAQGTGKSTCPYCSWGRVSNRSYRLRLFHGGGGLFPVLKLALLFTTGAAVDVFVNVSILRVRIGPQVVHRLPAFCTAGRPDGWQNQHGGD